MDKFNYKGREIEVVHRLRKAKPAQAAQNTQEPDPAFEMKVIEETPWFSLDDLKKRRFQEPT